MNEPVRSWPDLVVSQPLAQCLADPWASAPWIWPRTIIGSDDADRSPPPRRSRARRRARSPRPPPPVGHVHCARKRWPRRVEALGLGQRRRHRAPSARDLRGGLDEPRDLTQREPASGTAHARAPAGEHEIGCARPRAAWRPEPAPRSERSGRAVRRTARHDARPGWQVPLPARVSRRCRLPQSDTRSRQTPEPVQPRAWATVVAWPCPCVKTTPRR